MGKPGPAALNTRVARINIGTYELLRVLALKQNLSMAEALDRLITQQAAKERVTVIPRTQIPMTFVTPSIAVNGSKVAAFGTKIKGVRYE